MRLGAWLALAALMTLGGAVAAEKETKEEKADRKQKEQAAKNVVRYQKLRDYALEKYKTDLDFKEEVEESFDNLLRDHSQRAYDKNTQRESYMKVVHEDNWRIHVNLYDNLLVQDHINRIGQKLVPEGSERLFAFKVVPDPIPLAETLSTGTIYVSTGLISLLDSEAQIAYVLAHEMAHVQLDHWKEQVMMQEGQEAYAEAQAKKIKRIGLIGGIAGGIVGGAVDKSATGAIAGAALGASAGLLAGLALNRPLLVNWETIQEDAADELAFKQVLAASYDVREVPKLYTAMENATRRDTRVGLGFLGSRKRVEARREKANQLIANAFKAEIDAKLNGGSFVGDTAAHRNLMAELKRDNGIMAYYKDMFEMARTNLKQASLDRDNDPAVHYFYGKVLRLVGRTPAEHKESMTSFERASSLDYRNQNYGAHLHYALGMMGEPAGDKKAAVQQLDSYVTNYAKWAVESGQMRYFPPNLDSIYEYMRLYGDKGWRPKAPDLTQLANYQQLIALPIQEGPATRMPEPSRQDSPPPAINNPVPRIPPVPVVAPGKRGKVKAILDVGTEVEQRTRPTAPPKQ